MVYKGSRYQPYIFGGGSPRGESVERDVAQWLERGALTMSLPAARVGGSLGPGFSEKYHVSPLSTLGYSGINVVSLSKALHPRVLHSTHFIYFTL